MQDTAKPLPSEPHLKWRLWIIVPCVLAATAAVLALWFRDSGQVNALELAAKSELTKLGALVVMDADRKHVNSVNLSTLKSPRTLDQAVELLRPLVSLGSLNAAGTMFQDAHARVVGQLASLQDLVLSHAAITDSAVENLHSLSRLKSIHLAERT